MLSSCRNLGWLWEISKLTLLYVWIFLLGCSLKKFEGNTWLLALSSLLVGDSECSNGVVW
uniref:Uncharacterized protein n=1 Tax=Rhizophora mucronata TaxID=61149 RepID=A0A2P2ITE3_RHIMU